MAFLGLKQEDSRISNALPFPIMVQIKQDQKQITSFKQITNHEWGVSANAKLPGPVRGTIQGKYGGSYEHIAEGCTKYADPDQSGFVVIAPDMSIKWNGTIHPEKNYLTVYVILQTEAGKRCLVPILKDAPCKAPIRKGFGLNPATLGRKDFNPERDVCHADIAKEPKSWRLAPQTGPANHNYFPGFVCNTCKRPDRCPKTCSEWKEYGGASL